MEEKTATHATAYSDTVESDIELHEDAIDTLDGVDEDPLEDLDIDFLLEEVENKIAPLALAW